MIKGRILFIIDTVIKTLILLGYILICVFNLEYIQEIRSIDFLFKVFVLITVFILYRTAVPILLIILYNKKGFLRIMRIVAIASLSILSTIGAFYNYNYIDAKDSNISHNVNASIVWGRILMIIDLLLSFVITFFADWGLYILINRLNQKIGVAMLLFIWIVLLILMIPIIFTMLRLVSNITCLATNNFSSKFFRIMRVVAICTFSLFTILGLNLIKDGKEESIKANPVINN